MPEWNAFVTCVLFLPLHRAKRKGSEVWGAQNLSASCFLYLKTALNPLREAGVVPAESKIRVDVVLEIPSVVPRERLCLPLPLSTNPLRHELSLGCDGGVNNKGGFVPLHSVLVLSCSYWYLSCRKLAESKAGGWGRLIVLTETLCLKTEITNTDLEACVVR